MTFNVVIGKNFRPLLQTEVCESMNPPKMRPTIQVWNEPREKESFQMEAGGYGEARTQAAKRAAERGMQVHILVAAH